MLRHMTAGTASEHHFLSILQHMMVIRDDYWARPQFFKLLDQCVTQIVLHKSGIDPDFHYTKKFNVDVDPLIGTYNCTVSGYWDCVSSYALHNLPLPPSLDGLVDKAKVEESEARAYDLEQLVSHSHSFVHSMDMNDFVVLLAAAT